jgi:hypothetical protein
MDRDCSAVHRTLFSEILGSNFAGNVTILRKYDIKSARHDCFLFEGAEPPCTPNDDDEHQLVSGYLVMLTVFMWKAIHLLSVNNRTF